MSTYGLVYLAMEERTGKTFTAILTVQKFIKQYRPEGAKVLILTKKKALKDPEDRFAKKAKGGWFGSLNLFCENDGGVGDARCRTYDKDGISWTVTNYQQANKIDFQPDFIILDEAHSNLSSFPDRGKTWKEVSQLTQNVPIIFSSATPHAQGFHLLYNQLALSSYSPWCRYPEPNDWFMDYGFPYSIPTGPIRSNGERTKIPQFDRVADEKIKAETDHLFVRATRKELGFEHEPEDVIHWIELEPETVSFYNWLVEQKWGQIAGYTLSLENKMKERTTLHQIEGGALKYVYPRKKDEPETSVMLSLQNQEKIDYIKKHFGDTEEMVIMFNFKAEEVKLKEHFKKARIVQGTSYAEGVDFSHIEHLLIYSQDYSTARHSQRRARQANMKREKPINVHHFLVRGGVSEQVFQCVSVKKSNFVDSVYKSRGLGE